MPEGRGCLWDVQVLVGGLEGKACMDLLEDLAEILSLCRV